MTGRVKNSKKQGDTRSFSKQANREFFFHVSELIRTAHPRAAMIKNLNDEVSRNIARRSVNKIVWKFSLSTYLFLTQHEF